MPPLLTTLQLELDSSAESASLEFYLLLPGLRQPERRRCGQGPEHTRPKIRARPARRVLPYCAARPDFRSAGRLPSPPAAFHTPCRTHDRAERYPLLRKSWREKPPRPCPIQHLEGF